MRKTMLAVPLVLVTAATAQARDVKSDIEAANAQFLALYNKGDAAGIAQLYTNNATVLPPGSPMVRGRAAIQKAWQGAIDSGLKNFNFHTVAVEQFGNAAREIGEYSADTPKGREEGKYVVLWRHARAGWRLDTDIWNMNQ
ncbi:MAG: DUF4440 domain-containing protein [Acetobacteraceae bacterium]|nr:DUF4440 domain-containing protein [Acetobacteraceae bacterium]